MTAIAFVSLINYHLISGLHVFWDTLYNYIICFILLNYFIVFEMFLRT